MFIKNNGQINDNVRPLTAKDLNLTIMSGSFGVLTSYKVTKNIQAGNMIDYDELSNMGIIKIYNHAFKDNTYLLRCFKHAYYDVRYNAISSTIEDKEEELSLIVPVTIWNGIDK